MAIKLPFSAAFPASHSIIPLMFFLMEQIITVIIFSQYHLLHRKEEGDWSCGWTLSS